MTPRSPSAPGPALRPPGPHTAKPQGFSHDPGKFPAGCQAGFSSLNSRSRNAPVASVNAGPFAVWILMFLFLLNILSKAALAFQKGCGV